MALTPRQRRQLKAAGQRMADDIRLGTGGLSSGFIGHVRRLLSQKELVKLRFADTEIKGDQRRQWGQQIAQEIGAECVAVIGRTVLLYQPNPELAPAARALRAGKEAVDGV